MTSLLFIRKSLNDHKKMLLQTWFPCTTIHTFYYQRVRKGDKFKKLHFDTSPFTLICFYYFFIMTKHFDFDILNLTYQIIRPKKSVFPL